MRGRDSRAGGFAAAGERRASSIGLACVARSSRSDSAVSGSRSRLAIRVAAWRRGRRARGWVGLRAWLAGDGRGPRARSRRRHRRRRRRSRLRAQRPGGRGGGRRSARDALLLAARVGELVGVLERPGELLARRGALAERVLALALEPGGELGERVDAMLELADQRQAGVRELGAFERRGLGGEAVKGEVQVWLAGLVAEQFGVDLEAGELRDTLARARERRSAGGGERAAASVRCV